jgi:2'-5' RNA ligase superfamily protein
MVHSVELIFDPDTETSVRRIWAALAEAGLPSQARHRSPTNRPHTTLAVSERIDPQVDAGLSAPAGLLPLDCRLGAPMLFGRKAFTLVRLVVPSVGLLALHESVDAICAPHMMPGPLTHSRPGQWTPHVTLCRRLAPADVATAIEVIGISDVVGTFAGLRRWDGDARVEHPIG